MRADHDDGTAGIVDTLAEQVLTEAALLAAQQVGETLERSVAGSEHRLAAAAVVDQRVHRLLEHALFVAHDDLRRLELLKLAQTVVAVDDAAVEVVEVRGGETAAVELHHGAQVGRNDRQHGEHHPLRLAVALTEILGHLQALDELALLLARALGYLLAQRGDQRFDVYFLQQREDALGADAGVEGLVVGRADDLLALHDDVGALIGGVATVDDDVARILDGLRLLHRLEALRIFLVVEPVFALGDDIVLGERQVHHGRHAVSILRVDDRALRLERRVGREGRLELGLGHDRALVVALLVEAEGRLSLEEVVAEIGADLAELVAGDDVALIHRDVLDLGDTEGLFSLELGVVETVDAFL